MADTEFRQALAVGDWETALRMLAQDSSMTQSAMAAATGVSQSCISRLMNGRSQEPGIRTVRALCDGLGIPRPLAGLASGTTSEDTTNRRQALGIGAGVAGGALLRGCKEPAAASAAGEGGPRTDEALLAEATAILRRLEQHTPTRALLGSAVAHSDLARTIRHRSSPGAHARRLCAMESEAAGFTAWLYADLDEQASARHYYRIAINAAVQSGNPLLTCYMCGSFGQFATVVGAPAQGRDLIIKSRTHLPRSAPPIASLWLDTMEAAALARLGERRAMTLLDDAERRIGRVANTEPVWPWLFRFDQHKLGGYRAVAASHLGYHRTAEHLFTAFEHVSASPKQSAVTTVARAGVLAATGQVDQACQLAVAALRTGRILGSERIIRAVSDFRTRLRTTSSATTELDQCLAQSYEEEP
ncbi:MAG: helix-turn-helix domain-containing protein [Dactylosporangium sp.]|nr:helix-turn-helix domain-containing protein [Dactylosporangium sp.]NNJ62575.1 helix-turn-helix domain-containing protein [Dactylosporangium sp.]